MSRGRPLQGELEALFSGPLDHAAGQLVAPGVGGGFRPAADLLRPRTLREVLDRFERGHEGDPRAIASLWSQWYLGTLIVPAAVAGLRLARVLPLSVEGLEVRLDGDTGRADAFRLTDGGRTSADADVFARFRPLVRGHLEPLVEVLAEEAGLSTSLLWCNAVRYLQWTLEQVEALDAGRPAPSPARRLLEARTWPDGSPNPLRGRVERVTGSGREVLRRKVCCLRFLVDGVDTCGSLCPLPEVREGRTRGEGPAG